MNVSVVPKMSALKFWPHILVYNQSDFASPRPAFRPRCALLEMESEFQKGPYATLLKYISEKPISQAQAYPIRDGLTGMKRGGVFTRSVW